MTRKERKATAERDIRRMTRRLIRLHGDTTASDLADGIAWYDRARAAADAISITGLDDDIRRAAAVIAHLSPRESWSRNVANAARVMEAADTGAQCPVVHTEKQRAKAWAAATGATSPDANHGPKTEAFWANILGDADRVCVDSWAARAATGDMTHAGPSGRFQYGLMERAYQRAARAIGMAPRDLQAAIWINVRGSAV